MSEESVKVAVRVRPFVSFSEKYKKIQSWQITVQAQFLKSVPNRIHFQ